MMEIYGFLGWFAEEWYRNGGGRTEPVAQSRDNVIYVEFKAIREAKEAACEHRS
ncbi:hypothetical protein [Bradyrhizobium glycinis]|uniref:hypothetical protein n=1 Tax=Bradyrhizobium glycinis TaxID=2751812 RepID=UPI0018D696B1|nr:hypothetical protein [Bradyrhizobium glycinis]MBH5372207.1 hypothetical protein [Bradyrhizobium glycinis]